MTQNVISGPLPPAESLIPDNHPSKNPKDVSPDPSYKEEISKGPVDPHHTSPISLSDGSGSKAIQY